MLVQVTLPARLSIMPAGATPISSIDINLLQVRDEKGRKMSKSVGNVVDPVDVMTENSCDALRLTLATGKSLSFDSCAILESTLQVADEFTRLLYLCQELPIRFLQDMYCMALPSGQYQSSAAGQKTENFPPGAGTTPGQDLNLSLERVTANRNFTNKLWNAAKFVLLNLEGVDDAEWEELGAADFSQPESIQGLPLAEAWIVSTLHQVCFARPARL